METVIANTANPQPAARTLFRILNIALWILQFLLAALFLWHGQLMAFPPADMLAMINENIGEGLRMLIGIAEILAAAGLILPGGGPDDCDEQRDGAPLVPWRDRQRNLGLRDLPAGHRGGLRALEGCAHRSAAFCAGIERHQIVQRWR